jgi:hypothetical protein
VRPRHITLEFSFVHQSYGLLRLAGRGFLKVLDSVSELLEKHVYRIRDRLVRGDIDPIPEIIREVRGLENFVIIPFGVIYFYPGGRIFHGEPVLGAAEYLVFLTSGREGKRGQHQQYG